MKPITENLPAENKVLCPITGDTLLEILPIKGDLADYKKREMHPIKGGTYLDPYIKQIPALSAAHQLGGAYKIIFPPGTTEKLLQHKNNPYLQGTYMTAIQGPDGIQNQAGLKSLAVLQAPLIAFVVMSAITGQYFQTKIERTMRNISRQIDKLIQLILAEKESEVRSIYHFTQYVAENYDVIKFQDELRLSTLINIQRNNIQLFSLQKFYEKNISLELEKMVLTGKAIKSAKIFNKSEISELKEEISQVSDSLEKRQLCIDLYMMGRVLEIQLSSVYDKTYLDNLKKSLKEINTNDKILMNRVIDLHEDVFSIKSVKDEKSIPVGDIKKNLRLLEERKVNLSESVSGILTSIDGMIEIDNKGVECLYYDNQLHLLGN